MKQFTDKEIIDLSMRYTLRSVDIICADPYELKKLPSKRELRYIVDCANKLYDFDTLSVLNEKYDLSILDTSENEMEPVSPEAVKKAEDDFISFMKKIDSPFEMPGNKKNEK